MRGIQKRALTGTDVPASKVRTSSSKSKALVRWGWVSVFLLGSAQATECPSCAPSLEKQDGVDLRVANTAPIIEPDWELLLKPASRKPTDWGCSGVSSERPRRR